MLVINHLGLRGQNMKNQSAAGSSIHCLLDNSVDV